MNRTMLDIFRSRNVAIRFASDAHRPEDVGANIAEMQAALLVVCLSPYAKNTPAKGYSLAGVFLISVPGSKSRHFIF